MDYIVSSGITRYWTTLDKNESMHILSGGMAINTTVNSGGGMYVDSGGIANSTAASGGYIRVSNGGTANSTTFSGYGTGMYVDSGGIANSVVINRATRLLVYSGGTATNIEWTPCVGSVWIENGASATFVSSYSGVYYGSNHELISQSTVMDSKTVSGYYGLMYIMSGGTATNTSIDDDGELQVHNGGTANNTAVNPNGYLIVSSGGVANNTFISGGNVFVTGIMNSTIIISASLYADVLSGGIMNSTTISKGSIVVSSGGKLTGLTTIASGAIVSTYAGAILDFNISDIIPGAAARINDLSMVSQWTSAVFTFTVSDSQMNGLYTLANNASGFNKTVTVMNTSAIPLCLLTVGQTTNINGKDYTLNLDDSVLSVTVGGSSPPPVPTGSTKSDIDGNGVSDVMFVWTGNNYAHGYWMNGQPDWWSANAVSVSPDWDNLGSYDMSGDGKADAVMVGNVTVNGNKGAYIGYYQDGDDANGWVNIGYLNNADDIAWKNKVGNLTGNASGANSIIWYAPELYALGAWVDGTDTWKSLSSFFGGDQWSLIGCGDFDGDGKDSVVMAQNKGAKYYTVDIDSTTKELAASDSGWEVRAIGDFSGDGKDDIVAFHKETGLVAMWGNGSTSNWSQLGQLDAKDWFVVGAGDYNGDGKDDLLVRQYSTGMLGYYSGGNMNSWVEMGRGVDMNWTVIA